MLPEPKSVYKWISVFCLAWKLAFNALYKAVYHLLLNTGCTNFPDKLFEAVAKHFDKAASSKNIWKNEIKCTWCQWHLIPGHQDYLRFTLSPLIFNSLFRTNLVLYIKKP